MYRQRRRLLSQFVGCSFIIWCAASCCVTQSVPNRGSLLMSRCFVGNQDVVHTRCGAEHAGSDLTYLSHPNDRRLWTYFGSVVWQHHGMLSSKKELGHRRAFVCLSSVIFIQLQSTRMDHGSCWVLFLQAILRIAMRRPAVSGVDSRSSQEKKETEKRKPKKTKEKDRLAPRPSLFHPRGPPRESLVG